MRIFEMGVSKILIFNWDLCYKWEADRYLQSQYPQAIEKRDEKQHAVASMDGGIEHSNGQIIVAYTREYHVYILVVYWELELCR